MAFIASALGAASSIGGALAAAGPAIGAASAGVGLYNGLTGGGGQTDPSIQTKIIEDPNKRAYANALEPYLAGQVGQGVGNIPVDPLYQSRYNDLMGMNANDQFDKNVYNPQLALYKAQQAPLIDESFAGNLRGSGHYGAQQEGMANWNANMGTLRNSANQTLQGAQMSAGQNYQKQAYDQWYNSLPQNNPALKQGLDFLNNSTNTGQTILSGLDPGQNGWMGSLLSSLVGAGASQSSLNQITNALKSSNQASSNSPATNIDNANAYGDLTSLFSGV